MSYRNSQTQREDRQRRKKVAQWKLDDRRIQRNQRRLCPRCKVYYKSSYYGQLCIYCGRRV